MLESLGTFHGDGSDSITIAELLDCINEEARGEPDATKLAYLARCSSRAFNAEVKAILNLSADWLEVESKLKQAFGRSPDLIWKDMENMKLSAYKTAAKFIMDFKKLAEEAT